MEESKQKPIPRRLRFEVLRRDDHTCRYCGASAPDVPLTVDHVIPRALGGSDDATNLATACRDCNSGKAATSPDEHVVADVDATALLFAKAIERVADQRRADVAQLDQQVEHFGHLWAEWRWSQGEIPMDQDWRRSIARFIAHGLDLPDLERLIHETMNSRVSVQYTWKSFCKKCWNEVGVRQELARQAIEDGTV